MTAGLALVVLARLVDGSHVLLQLDAVGERLAALVAALEMEDTEMSDHRQGQKLYILTTWSNISPESDVDLGQKYPCASESLSLKL